MLSDEYMRGSRPVSSIDDEESATCGPIENSIIALRRMAQLLRSTGFGVGKNRANRLSLPFRGNHYCWFDYGNAWRCAIRKVYFPSDCYVQGVTASCGF
jgi:hypothetical protein